MSMNIYISGERKITFINSKNECQEDIQYIDFYYNVVQTPTDVSKKIMASEDKLGVYIDYVKSISHEEFINVYADDDYMHDRKSVKVIQVNYGLEMLDRLIKALNKAKDDGYKICWSMQ